MSADPVQLAVTPHREVLRQHIEERLVELLEDVRAGKIDALLLVYGEADSTDLGMWSGGPRPLSETIGLLELLKDRLIRTMVRE